MTKPVIKAWDISRPGPFDGPEDPFDFSELFLFGIGLDDAFPGSFEWFDIEVVTPAWLARKAAQGNGYAFGKGMLVVPHWDPKLVVRAVQAACDAVPEGEWCVIAEYLSRYFYYEFDGYVLPALSRHRAKDDDSPL